MSELDVQLQQSVRQRKLADLLRGIAEKSAPEDLPGRMISGHYVAPSWAQSLNNVLVPQVDYMRARQAEQQALDKETAFNTAQGQAVQQWQSALPQARAAVAERQGPVDPNNPQELAPIDAQPLTTGQVLRHTLMGMNIPGNEKAAELYNRGALADIAREDNQAAIAAEREATRAATLERLREQLASKAEEMRMRMEDRALDRASREQMARDRNAILAQIAQLNAEMKKYATDAKSATDKAKAEAAKGKLSSKEQSELDDYDATLKTLDDGIAMLEKSSGKGTGWTAGVVQNVVPGGASVVNKMRDKETNDAIQFVTYITDEIRHGRFGSALTATEKASAMQYLPGEYDDKDQILSKAKNLKELLSRNHSRLKEKAGMSEVAPTPANNEEKVVNGVTYTKINGQWYQK